MEQTYKNYNRITVIGFVPRDAQVFEKLAKFCVATENYRKDTAYHNCIAFGKHKDAAAEIRKGMIVKAEGELSYGKYKNKEGIEVKTCDIICNIIEIIDKGHSVEKKEPAETPAQGQQAEDPADSLPF